MNKYDLIVIGGGFSGVGAAISAAREGLSVLLIDKNNCLGGAASCCLVNPYMPYATRDPETKGKKILCAGIFGEINDELAKLGGIDSTRHMFNEEYLKLVLNRMAEKSGVKLLFNSYLVNSETDGEYIKSVSVVNKSGIQSYYADYYIDATGDADLAAVSGCSYRLGRDSDELCQPMTLCFRIANVDVERAVRDLPRINEMYKKMRCDGKIKNIREDVLVFRNPVDGVLHFNSTRVVKKNPVNGEDVTAAEIEAREQAFELYEFLKNNFEAFKNSQFIMSAAHIGVRESRMIKGKYILTQEDIVSCRRFEDSIAVGNYDIDIHNPEGSGTSHYYFRDGEYYTIPYRCLIPDKIKNLLVTGRCISSTHEAQASYRIMPICCCLGQAAGSAVVVAVNTGAGDVNAVDVKMLQKLLKDNNAVTD